MRIDKFTQKMQEAHRAAQDLASHSNHQEITTTFLSALLNQAKESLGRCWKKSASD